MLITGLSNEHVRNAMYVLCRLDQLHYIASENGHTSIVDYFIIKGAIIDKHDKVYFNVTACYFNGIIDDLIECLTFTLLSSTLPTC